MYRRKASLDHRPSIIIVYTGTSPRYIAIAAPDLMECVPTSPFCIPILFLPTASIAPSSASINILDVTWVICPFISTAETGVSSFEPG